jgi:hypothetical protein
MENSALATIDANFGPNTLASNDTFNTSISGGLAAYAPETDDERNAVNVLNPYCNLANTNFYRILELDHKTRPLYEDMVFNENFEIGEAASTLSNVNTGNNWFRYGGNVTAVAIPPAFKLLYKDPECRYIVFAALLLDNSYNTGDIAGLTMRQVWDEPQFKSGANLFQKPGIYAMTLDTSDQSTPLIRCLLELSNKDYIRYTTDILLNDGVLVPAIKVSGCPSTNPRTPNGIALIVDETAYWYEDWSGANGDSVAAEVQAQGGIKLRPGGNYVILSLHPTIFGNYTYAQVYHISTGVVRECFYEVGRWYQATLEIKGCSLTQWQQRFGKDETYIGEARWIWNRDKKRQTMHAPLLRTTNESTFTSTKMRIENRDDYLFQSYSFAGINDVFDYNDNRYTLLVDHDARLIKFQINGRTIHLEDYSLIPGFRDAANSKRVISHLWGSYSHEDNCVMMVGMCVISAATNPVTQNRNVTRRTYAYQLKYNLGTGELDTAFPTALVDDMVNLPVRVTGQYGTANLILAQSGYNVFSFDNRRKMDINNNWDTVILPNTMLLHENVQQLYMYVIEKRPFYVHMKDKIFIRIWLGREDPVEDTNTPEGIIVGDRYEVVAQYLRNNQVIWERLYKTNDALPAGEHRIELQDGFFLPTSPYSKIEDLVIDAVYDFRVIANLREY